MRSVRGIYRIESAIRPGIGYIQLDRIENILAAFLADPAGKSGQVSLLIGRLPGQVRQGPGKKNDVLPGTRSDFQHQSFFWQHLFQCAENRFLVAFT